MSDNTCPYFDRITDWNYRGWPKPEYCMKNKWNPTDERIGCYCTKNNGRDCYYMGGLDPYNLNPESKARREKAEKEVEIKRQKAAEQIRLDQQRSDESVARCVQQIEELPNEASLEALRKIRKARNLYRGLKSGERAKVYNLQKLENLEAQLKTLIDEQWAGKKKAMPQAEAAEGAEAPKMGMAKFLVWLNNFLVKACKIFDPRRYKRKNPLRSCRVVMVVLTILAMNWDLFKVPKDIWTSLLVFLCLILVSGIVSKAAPTATWVRGGIWLAAFVSAVVFAVLLLTTPGWLTVLGWMALALAWYPVLLLIASFIIAITK